MPLVVGLSGLPELVHSVIERNAHGARESQPGRLETVARTLLAS